MKERLQKFSRMPTRAAGVLFSFMLVVCGILTLSAHGGGEGVEAMFDKRILQGIEGVPETRRFEREVERKLAKKKPRPPNLPLTKEDTPEPEETTQEDRNKGWKLVQAAAGEAFRFKNIDGWITLFALANRAPIFVHIYFYKPAEGTLACQLYYNGNKEEQRGKKIGLTSVLPKNKLRKLQKGSLLIKMKGPKKKFPPPMRLVCGEKQSLPKVLSSEISENLLAIDVIARTN